MNGRLRAPGSGAGRLIFGRFRHAYKVAIRAAIRAVILPPVLLVRLLPFRAAGALGGVLGYLAWWVAGWQTGRMADIVARAFPAIGAGVRRRIARESLARLGRTMCEYLALTRLPVREMRERTTVDGLEHVLRAQAEGRGVIVLTGHVGSWEVSAAAVGLRVEKLAVIARDLYDPAIDRMTKEYRGRFHVATFDTNDARGILRHLKGGGVLGILIDQASRRVANVPVPFFGTPVMTPVGPVRLAEKTGSALVTGFGLRTGNGYRVVLEPLRDRVAEGEAPEPILAEYNRRLEAVVRERPEQWVWLHDRWALRPAEPAVPPAGQAAAVADGKAVRPAASAAGTTRRQTPLAVADGKTVRPPASLAGMVAASVAFVLAGGFSGCAPAPTGNAGTRAPAAQARTAPASMMHDAHLVQVTKGRIELEVKAAEAWESADSGWLDARGVTVTYYAAGRKPVMLSASAARYQTRTRRLEGHGRVRILAEGGLLETTDITWDSRQGRISSDADVKVTKGENVMTGRGLDADPDLEQVVIRENVRILAAEPADLKPLVEKGTPK